MSANTSTKAAQVLRALDALPLEVRFGDELFVRSPRRFHMSTLPPEVEGSVVYRQPVNAAADDEPAKPALRATIAVLDNGSARVVIGGYTRELPASALIDALPSIMSRAVEVSSNITKQGFYV